MRAFLLLSVVLLVLIPCPGAVAEDDAAALKERLAALRRRVIECIDRIEALEKEVASRGLCPTGDAAAERGAGEDPDWVLRSGMRFPRSRKFRHSFRIEASNPGRGIVLTVDRLGMRKDSKQGDWIDSAWLRVSTAPFDPARGVPPQAVEMQISMRYHVEQALWRVTDARPMVERLLGRFTLESPSGKVTKGATSKAATHPEGNGSIAVTSAKWMVPLDRFLDLLPGDEFTLVLKGKYSIQFTPKRGVLEALRDVGSRLVDPRRLKATARPVAPTDPRGSEKSSQPSTESGGAFAHRYEKESLRKNGGSRKTEAAVERALQWLAAHQSPDGRWGAADFCWWCDGRRVARGQGPDGVGKSIYDIGVSGLALCAFLGAGHTPNRDTPFMDCVSRGLDFLRSVQDAGGCFGPRTTQHYIYNHAIATLAVVEGYAMSGDPRLHESAQRGLDFIAVARNPYYAWRYGVKPGDNDTSVTGWTMSALNSAKLVNRHAEQGGQPKPFVLDVAAWEGAKQWIDKMTDRDYGRTGYLQRGGAPARPQELLELYPGDKSESMTGVGMLIRSYVGENPRTSAIIKRGAKLCAALPPTWNPTDGSIDMYYWYYATLAMIRVGGYEWDIWNRYLKSDVAGSQRKDGTTGMYKGSWDPIGPWGPDGGRVYSTAMCALCLEAYYRYEHPSR